MKRLVNVVKIIFLGTLIVLNSTQVCSSEIEFKLDAKYSNKLESIQWEMKSSQIGQPVLTGNRYQMVNLIIGRGVKKQARTLATNLGWYRQGKVNFNMKIQRKAGNGQVRYGDIVALHMTSYGWLKLKKQNYGVNLSDDDSNPNYIWVIKGGKKGQKLVTGMPFALFNTKEGREIVYCKRTFGINLAWQGPPCNNNVSGGEGPKLFGGNGILPRDGLTGNGFSNLKKIINDRGLKAAEAFKTDEFLAKMLHANIVFNSPSFMDLNSNHTIRLLLSLNKTVEELFQRFNNSEEIEGAGIKVANRMEARLSGQGFEILAVTPELQAISLIETTKWQWDVSPKIKGNRVLHLTFSAFITIDGEKTPRIIRTFDKDINVRVSFGDLALNFFMNNWQWLWTALLIPIFGWIWKVKKQKSKPKP